MNAIQRYSPLWAAEGAEPDGGGRWVTYADHVAAVYAAEVEIGRKWRAYTLADDEDSGAYVYRAGYEQGQRDALAEAVERIEEVPAYMDIPYESPSEIHPGERKDWLHYLGVIAAIKGEQ